MTLLALGSSMFPMTLGLLTTLFTLIFLMLAITLGLLIALGAVYSNMVFFFDTVYHRKH